MRLAEMLFRDDDPQGAELEILNAKAALQEAGATPPVGSCEAMG